jgi:glycosyltransferase involved in cell wall biosynthesis
MKKITVIGPTYPYKGGISHFTTILVSNLRKSHQVQFISWKRQYPSFLYPVEQKDTQSKQKISQQAEYILDFFNPISWIQASIKVKTNRSDVLVLNWVTPIQGIIYTVIAFCVRRITNTKIIMICHNVLPHERKSYDITLAKIAFSQVDEFIVHSSEDRDILTNLVKNKQIRLAFLPVFDVFETGEKYDVKRLKKQLGLTDKVLLFFGYIRPYKGLKYLIEAMPQILKTIPGITLLVVGEFWSKDRQEYMDLVDRLELRNNIVFVSSYVPNEEVGRYFAVSDVVVLPYTSATQSAVIQTAYAFNKPVISTPVGGLRDVIEDKITGYFVESQNPDDIAKKVKLFYKRPINQKDIHNIKERFSWDKYITPIQL